MCRLDCYFTVCVPNTDTFLFFFWAFFCSPPNNWNTCALAFQRLRSSSSNLLSALREPNFSDSWDMEWCRGPMSDWSFVIWGTQRRTGTHDEGFTELKSSCDVVETWGLRRILGTNFTHIYHYFVFYHCLVSLCLFNSYCRSFNDNTSITPTLTPIRIESVPKEAPKLTCICLLRYQCLCADNLRLGQGSVSMICQPIHNLLPTMCHNMSSRLNPSYFSLSYPQLVFQFVSVHLQRPVGFLQRTYCL